MEHQIDMQTEYGIGILRVSSTKQGLVGDSHEDQKQQILIRAKSHSSVISRHIEIVKWFVLTESASGELDMQPILKALEYCKNPKNKIKFCFIKSIDRGTRGGATIYGQLKNLFSKYGVQFIDVYGVIGTQTVNTLEHLGIEYEWSVYSPTYKNEMLVAEDAKDDVRGILTRLISAEVRYVRLGFRVRPAPPGFMNKKIDTTHGKRVILVPEPVESPWFIKMFELREQGNTPDNEIVSQVNAVGYKSRIRKLHSKEDYNKIIGTTGGKPLTIKQLQRYIQNPIYAGINTEKWTEGEPIKCEFPGLVSIEAFNKANRGKITIVEEGNNTVKIYKSKVELWRLRKQKENPLYPYKQYILCPICRNPLLASAPKGKSGKHFPTYHCARGHKYFGIPVKTLESVVEAFTGHVEFNDSFIKRFREIFLEEWNKRERQVSNDTISFNQRLIELEQEIQLLKDKIKILTSLSTIKSFEEDIEKLEVEKANTANLRDKREAEQIDIQILINYTQYFMEHLRDLLFGSTNPFQNAGMFGLLFDSPPTYSELENGTPRLAPLFKLNEEWNKSKEQSVTSPGIEPGLQG